MPSAKKIDEPGHITTGNVLEDLGFSEEEIREMEIKYDLFVPIRAEVEDSSAGREFTASRPNLTLQHHQANAVCGPVGARGYFDRHSHCGEPEAGTNTHAKSFLCKASAGQGNHFFEADCFCLTRIRRS
jgi:hypothetical protein